MPTRKIRGALAALAIPLAIPLLAAGLLVACGGGGSGTASPPASTSEEALRATQPGELVAYFKSRIAQRSAQGAWPVPAAQPGPGTADGVTSNAFSGTNLQEAGVDEDDLIKTDGSFVYAMHLGYSSSSGVVPPRLEARRVLADGNLGAPASVALDPQSQASGMYLAEDARRIAVLGSKQGKVSLDVFDVSDGAQPAHTTQLLIDGSTISTRRIGNVLYVASTWSPDLHHYWLPPGTPASQVEAALAGLNASALLPTIRTNAGPAQALVAEQDCFIQPADASLSLQLTTITAIDLSTPTLERSSRCIVGNGDTLYMSTAAVYVATSRSYWIAADFAASVLPAKTTTDIHKFALQGMQIAYRGSAEVSGHLGWDREKMPYRMSEYQGDLRIVTFTGPTGWIGLPMPTVVQQAPASPAMLTVLREDAAAIRLATVSTLPNAKRPAPIGHEGEQVYAVQFTGPHAYVVTFRRTDPLYVLDLSDPTDPKTVGELTVPGFSDYLFPLADGKLLGVGKDATAEGLMLGLKIALFDVSNPAAPSLLASRNLGERGTTSALDFTRHGINIFRDGAQARVALPVRVAATVAGVQVPTHQGLARYIVDTAAGTIEERPMVIATQFDGTSADVDRFARFGLGDERSLQATNATYYLSGGEVRYIAQP